MTGESTIIFQTASKQERVGITQSIAGSKKGHNEIGAKMYFKHYLLTTA